MGRRRRCAARMEAASAAVLGVVVAAVLGRSVGGGGGGGGGEGEVPGLPGGGGAEDRGAGHCSGIVSFDAQWINPSPVGVAERGQRERTLRGDAEGGAGERHCYR